MLFDTHCHLDFEWFDEDRDEVVARAVAAGVERIVVPAVDLDNVQAVLSLTERHEEVYAAVGVHPNSSAGWQDAWIDRLRALARHEKVVAIGEIGLDYYRDRSPKETQQRAFSQQLALAAELALPVIIHNRESDIDIVRLLGASPLHGRERPGVLHSFLSGWETAEAALEMGYYLGFSGPLTYKRNDDLRTVMERTPMDRLLIETDAPFLPPQAHRGERNEPAFVQLVAAQMAETLGLKEATVAAMTTDNAACLFGRHLLR